MRASPNLQTLKIGANAIQSAAIALKDVQWLKFIHLKDLARLVMRC